MQTSSIYGDNFLSYSAIYFTVIVIVIVIFIFIFTDRPAVGKLFNLCFKQCVDLCVLIQGSIMFENPHFLLYFKNLFY